MNIEQLKMVIDLLQSVGLEGKELFIWWMALAKGIPTVFGLIWSAIAVFFISKFFRFISEQSQLRDPEQSKLDQLRDAAGVSICFSSNELEKAKKVLREHYPR